MLERNNQFLETSFPPGRVFSGPAGFNTPLDEWLAQTNNRTVLSIRGRLVELLKTDYQAMLPLPPVASPIGLNQRVRLGRDCYVRGDTVDPRMIGRSVDVTASPGEVKVSCDGRVVARLDRCWAKRLVVTDPARQAAAALPRKDFAAGRLRREASGETRRHADGHVVAMRALPDCDALFGADFTASPTNASNT